MAEFFPCFGSSVPAPPDLPSPPPLPSPARRAPADAPWPARAGKRHHRLPLRQQGFSLVELSIVTAIILVISIIGIPAINSYVIENKVPEVAGELQRYVARTKANGQGTSNPYTAIDTANLGRALRSSSVVSVDATTFGRVAHGLGGNGTTSGLIAVAPSDSGASFTVTLDAVNDAACPALASLLQRVSERIEITGASTAVVKDSRAATPLVYSPITTQAACQAGDNNTFAFTVW